MAYYSSEGQIIRQGAAGLGDYFDGMAPWAGAYQDGSLGADEGGLVYGQRRAFHDGSLGEYFDGQAPWAGAYQDGSLGSDEGGLVYGQRRAYQDGSLGEYEQAAAGVGAAYEQAAAGVGLGYPLFIDGKPVDHPVSIYHGPMSGCSSCGQVPAGPLEARREGVLGALGAVVDANTLDLQNPAAIKELKAAIAAFVPEIALAQSSAPGVGTSYYDADFYNSPIWDVKADTLWWAAQTKLLALPNSIYKAPSDITQTKGTHNWPKPAGVAAVSMLGVGSPAMGADYFQKNFPILFAYNSAITAAGGKLSGFKVTEPFFTQAETVKGKGFSFAGMGMGALLGIGAVAAVGAYLVLRK